jgi:hypothetical protein
MRVVRTELFSPRIGGVADRPDGSAMYIRRAVSCRISHSSLTRNSYAEEARVRDVPAVSLIISRTRRVQAFMCTNPHHVCLLTIAAIVHYSVRYFLAFPETREPTTTQIRTLNPEA